MIILALGGLAALGVYLTDKTDWGLLVPVYVLWVIAGIIAITKWADTDSNLFPAAILFLIAVPFLAVFYRDQKEHQWALIPAYVLLAIIPIILFEGSRLIGNFTATYVLTMIAIPFLFVYYRNRSNWWALIPAYVMLVIGFMVGILETDLMSDNFVPPYVLLAISLPFFYVYFRNKNNWWALIPGGVTGLIGLAFLISEGAAEYAGPILLITAGLWLLFRKTKERSPS